MNASRNMIRHKNCLSNTCHQNFGFKTVQTVLPTVELPASKDGAGLPISSLRTDFGCVLCAICIFEGHLVQHFIERFLLFYILFVRNCSDNVYSFPYSLLKV